MRLGSDGADVLELSIVVYQFPYETWDLHYQALTCDESPRLASWLGAVAEAVEPGRPTQPPGPARICFTEANLAFEVETYRQDQTVITAELDLEFRAPSNRPDHRAGNPTLLHISLSSEQLDAAAANWDADIARYPDRLTSKG